MVLYEVFSHSDRFHYRSTVCSLATWFLILCTILTFLPPFLFAYYAGGYWIKQGSYSEQPRINDSSRYIIILDDVDNSRARFFTSYETINANFRELLLPGTSSFSTNDLNSDGVTDQFDITFDLSFDTSTSIKINNINIWLIFQYELRARQYINMETMVLINPIQPGSISLSNNPNVTIVGDLVLEQRQPIQSSGSDTTYNKSIINLDNLFKTSSLNFNPILDEYFTRKFYTSFQTQSVQWKPGANSKTNVLTIRIVANIGKQYIKFTPGFWQEFKWGWIQYVCVLLPFIYAFNRIKEFVFRSQVVRTLVDLPFHLQKVK